MTANAFTVCLATTRAGTTRLATVQGGFATLTEARTFAYWHRRQNGTTGRYCIVETFA